MKSINLYWFKLPDGSTNYGDELNKFIIEEISGLKINYIRFPYKPYKIPFIYFYNRIRRRISSDFKGMLISIFAKNVLFAIGSILHIYDRKNIIVWGSGILDGRRRLNNAKFKAVRGFETLKKIKALGYNTEVAIGDPALLLPIILNPSKKKFKIGITLNYIQYNEFLQKQNIPSDYILINFKEDVQTVTEQITSCEYIISTSLHGLIVAHSYNIPALWVNFNLKKSLAGDNIKFKDYFSGIGIMPYSPIIIESLDINYIKNLFEENQSCILMNSNLISIQKQLLKSFPFNLKRKYQLFINN